MDNINEISGIGMKNWGGEHLILVNRMKKYIKIEDWNYNNFLTRDIDSINDLSIEDIPQDQQEIIVIYFEEIEDGRQIAIATGGKNGINKADILKIKNGVLKELSKLKDKHKIK